MERAKQLFSIVIPSILNNDPVTLRVPTLLNWTYPIIKKRAFMEKKRGKKEEKGFHCQQIHIA